MYPLEGVRRLLPTLAPPGKRATLMWEDCSIPTVRRTWKQKSRGFALFCFFKVFIEFATILPLLLMF